MSVRRTARGAEATATGASRLRAVRGCVGGGSRDRSGLGGVGQGRSSQRVASSPRRGASPAVGGRGLVPRGSANEAAACAAPPSASTGRPGRAGEARVTRDQEGGWGAARRGPGNFLPVPAGHSVTSRAPRSNTCHAPRKVPRHPTLLRRAQLATGRDWQNPSRGTNASPTAPGRTARRAPCAGTARRSTRRCRTWCRSAARPCRRAGHATGRPARRG